MSRLLPAVLMAWRNLTRTKIRSILAALGIVIGVIAIASLGMLGATLRQQATQNLGDIGNQVVVYPSSEDGSPQPQELSRRTIRDIERIAGDAAVAPVDRSIERISFGREQSSSTVYRMSNPAAVYTAKEGRIPTPLRNGALVGTEIAKEFDLEPGNSITVNGSTYRIRAVLAEQSRYSPVDPNDAIILPSRGQEKYSQVIIEAESGTAANETAMELKDRLNDRKKTVSVFELSSFTEQINQFFSFLNAFLIGLGSISLLVAGISILNVMLMSTVERREEIGVLRAVGFQKRDVLKIMLTEAVLLGAAGGIVGALFSVGVGAVVAHFALQDATVILVASNIKFLVLGIGFGIGTSLLSGLYPAWKAANEHPVEALRS